MRKWLTTVRTKANSVSYLILSHHIPSLIISYFLSHLGQSLHMGVSGEGLGNSGDPRSGVVEFMGTGSVAFVLPDTSFLCFFCIFFFSPAFPDSLVSMSVIGVTDELEWLALSFCRVVADEECVLCVLLCVVLCGECVG